MFFVLHKWKITSIFNWFQYLSSASIMSLFLKYFWKWAVFLCQYLPKTRRWSPVAKPYHQLLSLHPEEILFNCIWGEHVSVLHPSDKIDVCHHHSADLWPLRKWSDGLLCPEEGQQLEDRRLQIVCSILYRWIVLINASVDAWGKGVEQFPSARAAGGSGMGCLRGHHTVPGGWHSWAQRGFLVTPRTPGTLNPGTCCWRLCCSHGIYIGPCHDSSIH